MSQTKIFLRKIAETFVSNDLAWISLSITLVRGTQFLYAVRHRHEAEQIITTNPGVRSALEKRSVIYGPFQGMKYGSTKAFCGAVHPKMLGVYENEITKIISNALAKKHKIIVDIGAADGYYAVGFALNDPQAKVIAYEMDSRARTELVNLREINGVGDRVEIRGKCEPQDLLNLGGESGLVIMDCEGYEEILLTAKVIDHLKSWDFIIETHDGILPEITTRLTNRFNSTHTVVSVEVIHDLNKADHLDIPLLKAMPRRELNTLLAENRQHACLRWIACYARPESHDSPRIDTIPA